MYDKFGNIKRILLYFDFEYYTCSNIMFLKRFRPKTIFFSQYSDNILFCRPVFEDGVLADENGPCKVLHGKRASRSSSADE